MKKALTEFAIKKPIWVIVIAVLITAFFAAQFPKIQIDTDPENMLAEDEPVRVFEHDMKELFGLSDFLAVGIVNEPSAFTPDILNRIYRITAEIEEIDGVISEDIMAPSTVDDINQGEAGELIIESLMADEIETQSEADHIFARIQDNAILRGKLAGEDGKAIAIMVPIESKDQSRRIATEIQAIADKHAAGFEVHIAGLPMAEDSFGAQMFAQMAYSAPAAMLIIFLLLWILFRKAKVVAGPMIVAMMTVIWSMGLLILTGNTVHIMSSMIPIFLMPIAVLDSVHILSEFHDNYRKGKSKETTIRQTISELFTPMLFTSLTTFAGFLSLTLAPIPPVQVFGIFVAFGILVAWLLSITLNPAIGMLISEKTLRNFGGEDSENSALAKIMHGFRGFSYRRNKAIILGALALMVISAVGLSMIVVNDNPVKWFKRSHPIRVADAAMNMHLAGTYMNYLVLEGAEENIMKRPDVQHYLEALQDDLVKNEIVGAVTGLPDIVKKVRYELFGADSSKLTLPDNANEIGQMLFLYEMSGGDPDDLFKFVTPEYDQVNLWVQMKNGDNLAVSSVVERGDRYLAEHPLPDGITARWAGLPYINIEWQDQMVTGMRNSLLGSYVVVLIMMMFLFRSWRWGLASMLPLTMTIMAIYAFIGYIGKPYDMPVAVLSSLTLGLSIDFAIHFIQRLRMIHKRTNDFRASFEEVFESTGRAIARNVLVIAIGFVPMLFSSLVPYITVGSFFLAIMIVSGLVTMLLLPAVARTFHKKMLPTTNTNKGE
ncbi:MAG: MMPL family transporter [candidate division Zixibacteria bacterium]|nr:MMPL family transporter [candidate division Zixibacteria bacterium]MDH3936373.1 MMPL family transporter [candidate division Zixibacteria bacterium]MDH4032204.1 MMPL family transporter [candidate division Zixibacteria bacterium]